MTNEEALALIEDNLDQEGMDIRLSADDITALTMACEAIKKRTPRMVKYEDRKYIKACGYCPSCNYDFYGYEAAVWRMPYCPNCGQALRWDGDEK